MLESLAYRRDEIPVFTELIIYIKKANVDKL